MSCEPHSLPDRRPGGEWRQRQAWPPTLRFADAVTERVILRALPPRPVLWQFGNSAAMCVEARFAEDAAGEK
jgi:hypothetical protein